MCLICIEYNKRKMTLEEAGRAFCEMAEGLEPNHLIELFERLCRDAGEAGNEDVIEQLFDVCFGGWREAS
jgi:hypothetical protein